MTKYQREGKNAHDDAPDTTTGIAEKIGKSTTSYDKEVYNKGKGIIKSLPYKKGGSI